jgi:hypothetical protein
MSDKKIETSFWLELEAASKGLSIAGDQSQSEQLKQLFTDLVSESQREDERAPTEAHTRT